MRCIQYAWERVCFHLIFNFWSQLFGSLTCSEICIIPHSFQAHIPLFLTRWGFYSSAIMERNSVINTEVSPCVCPHLAAAAEHRGYSEDMLFRLWLYLDPLCPSRCPQPFWRLPLSGCLAPDTAERVRGGGQSLCDLKMCRGSAGAHSASCRALQWRLQVQHGVERGYSSSPAAHSHVRHSTIKVHQ